MEQLKPLLRILQKNIDRVALVVFFALTGAVLYLQQTEGGDVPTVTPPPLTPMPTHLPNDQYNQVLHSLSWDGQLYQPRPLDDEHPFIDLVRFNMFAEREPPSEQEVNQRVAELLQQAREAERLAGETRDPDRMREELQQVIRLCDQVVTVWRAQSDTDQAVAREMRERAQAALDALNQPPGS